MAQDNDDVVALKAECELRAVHTGKFETSIILGLARLSHHLGCLNSSERIGRSYGGALQIPQSMLSKMGIGLARTANNQDVFCVLVGEYLWEMLKATPLLAGVIDKKSRGINLIFQDPIVGEFKARDFSLFLPINSDKIWEAIHQKKISHITLGRVIPSLVNEGRYTSDRLHIMPAPLVIEAKQGRVRREIF